MNYKEIVLSVMKKQGMSDALDLRKRSSELSQTEIIREEEKIPDYDSKKDYSNWPVGAPVKWDNQVWLLLQPYNAMNVSGTPDKLRSLWGLAHTKDADRAKLWVDPLGTSGVYMKDECYLKPSGVVVRSKFDNQVHNADALPSAWVVVNDSRLI